MTASMISVTIFQEMHKIAYEYSSNAFNEIAKLTTMLYFTSVSLWWTYLLINYARGKGDLSKIMEHLFIITFISILLLGFNSIGFSMFYRGFYEPVDSLVSAVAKVLLQQMPNNVFKGDSALLNLLGTLEHEIDVLIEFQKAMSSAVAWYNISAHIMLFLVMLPYLFVWLIFLAYVINYIFKITAITVLSPIMVALFTFPSLRKYSYSMAKIVFSGGLTLIFASVAMGFTLRMFHHYMELLPVGKDNELQVEAVTDFIFSTNFVALFVFGGVSVLFHLKAPVLARAISGVADGAGAETFVAGIGTSAMAVSKSFAFKGISKVASLGGRAVSSERGYAYFSNGKGSRIDPTKNLEDI